MIEGTVLAMDQGTSATKALLVRADGSVAASATAPVMSRTVGADGVELEAEEIWESVVTAARRVMSASSERPVAVALANQGETVLAWDSATGKPLSPAISWQDRRAAAVCNRLRGYSDEARSITGLILDPYFSAPKMAWLRENVVREGVVTTTDAWLLHQLTGEFVTDAATASRTLLLDLDAAGWSSRMCELFGLDADRMPRIVANDQIIGTTTVFDAELPVAGAIVDQQAALLAQGCLSRAQAKCTYGTGAFLLANLGENPIRSEVGLVACIAWAIGGAVRYCLDGQLYTAGSAIDWLGRLGVINGPADLDALAETAKASDEVFVPALAGLAAPFWSTRARASLSGMSLDTDRSAVVYAVLEGIAANVAVLAQATARDLGQPLDRLRVDGGLTRSRVLMQIQADLLQLPVDVYQIPDATALGASALARLALGQTDSVQETLANWRPTVTYEPSCPADVAAERLEHWNRAVRAAIALEHRG